MKSIFFIMGQLGLVTAVFFFAYRAGYKSAQSKAISVVKKFADPVTCLLDNLNDALDETAEAQKKKEGL